MSAAAVPLRVLFVDDEARITRALKALFRDLDALLYDRLTALREILLCADTSVRIVVTPERLVIDEGHHLEDADLFTCLHQADLGGE